MKVRLLEKKGRLVDLLDPFLEKLKIKYPGLDLDYKIIQDKYFGSERNQIAIKFIKSSKFGQGPLALQKLCDWVDKHDIFLSLCAVDFYGMNINTLIKGYKRMGFESSESSPNNMLRKPQ
jgi:hypothetical protein